MSRTLSTNSGSLESLNVCERCGCKPKAVQILRIVVCEKPVAFAIERIAIDKKTGQSSRDMAYGITSRAPAQADAQRLLEINRGHWTIENSCHYILDWNYDEDRCRIRTGHGPENITRLRRFAISVIKSKGVRSVAQTMRQLNKNTRLVFDYLRMTNNSRPARPT